MLVTKIFTKTRFELKTSQKLWLTQILHWQHNQLSYGMFSINILLCFNISQTIFMEVKSWKDKFNISTTHQWPPLFSKFIEGQVIYPYCLHHQPGYGRTSYISILSALPTCLVMERQVMYPYCLLQPPGYGRTHYINTSPPTHTHTWLHTWWLTYPI